MTFFLGSSKVTRIGAARKQKIEDGHQIGGNRNWVQVAANGASTQQSRSALHAFGGTAALNFFLKLPRPKWSAGKKRSAKQNGPQNPSNDEKPRFRFGTPRRMIKCRTPERPDPVGMSDETLTGLKMAKSNVDIGTRTEDTPDAGFSFRGFLCGTTWSSLLGSA